MLYSDRIPVLIVPRRDESNTEKHVTGSWCYNWGVSTLYKSLSNCLEQSSRFSTWLLYQISAPPTDFWGTGLWRSSVSILEVLVSLSKILSSEIKRSIDILKFSFLRSSTSVSEWTAGSGDKFQTFGLLQTDRNKDALSISPANENFLQVSRKQGTKVLT